jgi:hypothetical protein
VAKTSPCEGFSAAEPGKTIPPAVVSSSSLLLTRSLSPNGLVIFKEWKYEI